jgi:hypothetical protein
MIEKSDSTVAVPGVTLATPPQKFLKSSYLRPINGLPESSNDDTTERACFSFRILANPLSSFTTILRFRNCSSIRSLSSSLKRCWSRRCCCTKGAVNNRVSIEQSRGSTAGSASFALFSELRSTTMFETPTTISILTVFCVGIKKHISNQLLDNIKINEKKVLLLRIYSGLHCRFWLHKRSHRNRFGLFFSGKEMGLLFILETLIYLPFRLVLLAKRKIVGSPWTLELFYICCSFPLFSFRHQHHHHHRHAHSVRKTTVHL